MPPVSRMIDLTGNVYGRLTVEQYAGKKGKLHYWLCRCSCGGTATPSRNNLKSGRSQSCGCLLRERTIQRSTSHGASSGGRWTREYTAWNSMRKRCGNPGRKEWKYYGGKGVRVCDRWNSFANFLADMGLCPPGYTLERKDGAGHYEPDNCVWAARSTQSRNRSVVELYTHAGTSLLLREWSEKLGVKLTTLRGRLNRGWSVERTLTTLADK